MKLAIPSSLIHHRPYTQSKQMCVHCKAKWYLLAEGIISFLNVFSINAYTEDYKVKKILSPIEHIPRNNVHLNYVAIKWNVTEWAILANVSKVFNAKNGSMLLQIALNIG